MSERSPLGRSPADQLLLSARELRIDERFGEASAALARASALSPSAETARLIRAEQARLSYYLGDFEQGVRLAADLADDQADIASARAALAASVNLMALNRAHDARTAASAAHLRFRSIRARGDDLADVLIQLAHIEAHMGNPRAAIENARAAVRITSHDPEARRLHGRALCAAGLALTYAGDQDALEMLLEAERVERERAASLWHWIQFCVAAFLRDRGYPKAAGVWLARSGVALRHERAWFALRAGDPQSAGTWLGPPIAPDERPYVRSLIAATRAARGMRNIARAALRASDEFDHLGMRHWSLGARWIAAADPNLASSARRSLVLNILRELEDHASVHWAFFDPTASLVVLKSGEFRFPTGSHGQAVARHCSAWSTLATYEDDALLGTLSLLRADAMLTFADLGLTPAEIRAISTALDLWLQTGDGGRPALAGRLGLRETSVRSLLNDLRAKLSITSRRGIEPLIFWLAEHELLSTATASRVVQRLTAPRTTLPRRRR